MKNSLRTGTGLIDNHWFLEAKVTGIHSDGYIDRARSDLKSYFVQTGYYSEKTIIKLVSFGGLEETYQAWYGVDTAAMRMYGRTFNWAGVYYQNDTMKFYPNFIDHYQQDNIQLHAVHKLSDNLSINGALHFTYGRGYYEEIQQNQDLNFYGFPYIIGPDSATDSKGNKIKIIPDTIKTTDLVRRLWLNNKFLGGTWGLTYTADKVSFVWGGAINSYFDAKHYGEVIWARVFPTDLSGKIFYMNTGFKNDLNTYLKLNYKVIDPLTIFGDIQLRQLYYKASGLNKEYADQEININQQFTFINPKVGLMYKILTNTNAYVSYAIANREPTRTDILSAAQGENPTAETLGDLEIGFRQNTYFYSSELVLYNMDYHNQLVPTGSLDNVGNPIHKNIGKSYRRGAEFSGMIRPIKLLKIEGNLTFSINKIPSFSESQNDSVINYKNKDISFSPSLIAGAKLLVNPLKNIETGLLFKYVGKQFIDNTQDESRKLNPYSIFDFYAAYSIKFGKTSVLEIHGKVNNLFNRMYFSNANISGSDVYYFPQAGINYLIGLNLKF